MKSISFVVSQYLVDVWGEDLPHNALRAGQKMKLEDLPKYYSPKSLA